MKIAFIGKMFSGKTTAAEYLVNRHGYERLAFARPVKELAAEILTLLEDRIGANVPSFISMNNPTSQEIDDMRQQLVEAYKPENIHTPIVFPDNVRVEKLPPKVWTFADVEQKKGHPAVRKLLQLVGTELGRELIGYENVWVDKLIQRALHIENAVVDDCRFPNEAEALRRHGFTIIRVERPVADRMEMMVENYPETYQEILLHPSELGLDSFEADVIFYAENLDQLYNQVETIVTAKGTEN
jgi:hypothetical protein